MKNLSLLFAIESILLSVFVLDLHYVYVAGDGTAAVATTGAMSEIMKTILTYAPLKLLSFVQLGLLARLLSNRRNSLGSPGADGIDNDRDGEVDEADEWTLDSNKKNVMIFMGKHNIQVSNHGLQKDEEECNAEGCCGEEGCGGEVEGGEDDDDENDDDDSQNENYGSSNSQGDNYKKVKTVSYGGASDDEGIDQYKKYKKTKSTKKTYKKKQTKQSYGASNDEDEDEYNTNESEPNYKPTFLNFANSINKPTKTLIPWLKNLVQGTPTNAPNAFKDSNIMALPDGFPIGGSKLENFKKRIDFNHKDPEHQPSESELIELLSNPKVVELLHNLNESLANQSNSNDLKRAKRQLKSNNNTNNNQSLTEESKQKSKHSSSKTKSYIPSSFKGSQTYSSSFNPIINLKPASKRLSDDLSSLSSFKSVEHPLKPMESMESTNSYKLGDYMSFKPLIPNYKTSSSMSAPSYGEMETTDDDEYDHSDEGSQYSHQSSEGSEYGNDGSEYGQSNEGSAYGPKQSIYREGMFSGMYGGGAAGFHPISSMSYGGMSGHSGGNSPNVPVMDLSYWNNVIKKTNKKYKKKKKRYTTTTESPVTEEEEEDDECDVEECEEGEPKKKIHTTIQIIKSGSKTGNIGIGSGNDEEERSSRGFVRRFPRFRQMFGKR